MKQNSSYITIAMLYENIVSLRYEVAELKKQINPNKKQKYYNYVDAAEILCISLRALKERVYKGKIQKITNEGTPLIAHQEILMYLKKQNPGLKEN